MFFKTSIRSAAIDTNTLTHTNILAKQIEFEWVRRAKAHSMDLCTERMECSNVFKVFFPFSFFIYCLFHCYLFAPTPSLFFTHTHSSSLSLCLQFNDRINQMGSNDTFSSSILRALSQGICHSISTSI